MYSISTRANSVFFYGVIMIAILCSFNIITTILHKDPPVVNKFTINEFNHLYMHPYTKVQHANGNFTLLADFTPCFNWNTNLVFAWISATYSTGKNNISTTVTIWDNIMKRDQPNTHKVNLNNVPFEYPLVDHFNSLIGKNVEFTLNYEHMPVVGPILKKNIPLGNSTLPKAIKNPSKTVILREYDYYDYEE